MKPIERKAFIRLASALPKRSPERRTLLAALKPQMSGAGGWVVYNDKTKKQVAQGFSDLHAAKRWIEDRERFNKKTHHLLQQKINKGIKGLEKWVAKLYLNDLNKAYNQMGDLEGAFNQLGDDIRDEYGDYVSRSDYTEFYEDLTDSGFYGLEEAIEEVEHDLNEMIGNGWADDGYEDQVQEEIEDQILPRFEDALDTFRAEYGKVPRVAALTHKKAHIDNQTLDQLVDMAVESVGGDPTNSDFTPALKGARDKWHNAVEDALEKWLKKPKNFAKLDLDSSVFRGVEDQDDIDMVVEALQEHRGGAGYLYFMEMEGHGVGTWDGDWDQLFVDGDRTVSELSKYMERTVSREHQNLKNEIDEIAFASVPEDEDGYEDDSYAHNRYATRGALIRLASTLPKGSEERKALLASVRDADTSSFCGDG